jgi:2-iminobutanoate/2-iminopropanoate deaminase
MIEPVQTNRAPTPRGFYTQAVHAGDLLFISGQLPLDVEGRLVGTCIAEQLACALQNLTAILEAGGASLSDLVSVTIYICDVSFWPEVNAIYERALATVQIPPARAIVPVNKLHYGALIEIQAIAYLERRKLVAHSDPASVEENMY